MSVVVCERESEKEIRRKRDRKREINLERSSEREVKRMREKAREGERNNKGVVRARQFEGHIDRREQER